MMLHNNENHKWYINEDTKWLTNNDMFNVCTKRWPVYVYVHTEGNPVCLPNVNFRTGLVIIPADYTCLSDVIS